MKSVHLLPALLVSSPIGCRDYQCEQNDLKDISPGLSENLNDVDLVGYDETQLLAVGEGGVIVTSTDFGPFAVERPVDVDLHAALFGPLGRAYVAGTGGTLLTSIFGSGSWESIETGTSADLHELAWVSVYPPDLAQDPRDYQLAVGDEVVLLRDPVDDSWDLLPPPAGGWGRLRVVVADDLVHVAGLGGVIWSTDDPRGTWTRVDLDTTADLLGGGDSWYDATLVGVGGTIVYHTRDRWSLLPSNIQADLIALDENTAIGSDGHAYDLLLPNEPERSAWVVPNARGVSTSWSVVVTVGAAGRITRVPDFCD